MSLGLVAAAALFTVFLWWFSTGAILWLDRLPRATYRWSLAAGLAVSAAAVGGLFLTRDQATPLSAFAGFTCAIVIWGWHELSFLTGFITGPRIAPCPPGATGWRRFRLAAATLIYHELALALTAAGLVAITWGRADPIGSWTFLILLASRISAKLNLFLGVPNFTEAFFPDHLRFLTSYLRKSSGNALLPLSIVVGGAVSGAAAWLALDPFAGPFQATACALVFALTGLAVLEHAFMVLPLPDAALWRWAFPSAERPSAQGGLFAPIIPPTDEAPSAPHP